MDPILNCFSWQLFDICDQRLHHILWAYYGSQGVRSEDWEFNVLPYILILAVFASMCLPLQFPQGHFSGVGVDADFGP